jgi:ribA/ribD-fused uncharacterized protein
MIAEFQDKYRPLSNFWYTSVYLPDDDLIYPTVEHAYQAAKTDDIERRKVIQKAGTPSEAKRLGSDREKTIVRANWNTIRRKVMLFLLRQKFEYSDMQELLLSTGTQKLVEGNTWHDNYWGVCNCQSCTQERTTDKTLGKNWLGKLLMFVRLELQIRKGIE